MEFPWMMYRKGEGLPLPHGESVECQAARDEQEFKDAINAGWFPSVPEALAEKLAEPLHTSALEGEAGPKDETVESKLAEESEAEEAESGSAEANDAAEPEEDKRPRRRGPKGGDDVDA